jgi:hypothetical protein
MVKVFLVSPPVDICDPCGFWRNCDLLACDTMRKVLAEKVSDQISEWGHRGLVDDNLLTLLKSRYRSDEAMFANLLRWLGFLGVWLLSASIIGVVSMSMGRVAEYLMPIVLLVFSYYLWRKGTRMSVDPEQRHPVTGAVLVTVGLIAAFGALLALYALLGGRSMRLAGPIMMFLVAGAAFFTAYRFGLRWPLILGVLLAFHALGNMHRYGGHGSYFMGIQDERDFEPERLLVHVGLYRTDGLGGTADQVVIKPLLDFLVEQGVVRGQCRKG